MTISVPALLSLALLAAPAVSFAPAASTAAAELGDGRVIVIGFDGADGRTVEELMDAGELPNLSALREQGTFARLGTSVPSESPVSWASLNTGQNPAKTGVPGFVTNTGQQAGGTPRPGLGHLRDRKGANAVPIEEFERLPIPAWPAAQLAAAAFGIVLVCFLFLFAVLLRMKTGIAVVLSLLLAGLGGLAGHQLRGLLPVSIPKSQNPIDPGVRNLWDIAAENGVDCIVLDAAQAFDMPAPPKARVLAGLGVPDARGGLGDWFIYTTDPDEIDYAPEGRSTGTAGTVFRVEQRGGKITSALYGPRDFVSSGEKRAALTELQERVKDPKLGYKESIELANRIAELKQAVDDLEWGADSRVQVPLVIENLGDRAVVTIDGVSQTLAVGDWSDYYRPVFRINPLIQVHAITRVRLVSLGEPFTELIVKRLDIDPEHPPFWQPISTPTEFAGELAHSGLFDTYGWSTFTMPFKDREIPPEILMEDVEFTLGWRERVTYEALARDDWKLLMSVFSTTDRVQHMMYQYYDEGHPQYDAEAANREMVFFGETIRMKDAVPAIYRQMDRVVGEIMGRLGSNDVLLVCSDHGFESFRTQFHINNWLAENGYLTIKPSTTDKDGRMLSSYVDWSETRAYALGLGFIYVNLAGREKFGSVAPEDRAELLAQLRADLLAEVDEATGVRSVKEVYLPEEIHRGGKHLDREADMILGFAPNYRVSWRTSGGGLKFKKDADGSWAPAPVYADNTSPWSGGHVSVNATDVRGVFFANRRLELPEGGPNLLNIAPTVLEVLGVPLPPELDLDPLAVQAAN